MKTEVTVGTPASPKPFFTWKQVLSRKGLYRTMLQDKSSTSTFVSFGCDCVVLVDMGGYNVPQNPSDPMWNGSSTNFVEADYPVNLLLSND